MTIEKRSMVGGILLAFAFVIYGAAKYYSPSLILYVVEQTLVQKAPAETDPAQLKERLQALLSTAPDQKEQLGKLLRISQHLEKVQQLTPGELDKLLEIGKP